MADEQPNHDDEDVKTAIESNVRDGDGPGFSSESELDEEGK